MKPCRQPYRALALAALLALPAFAASAQSWKYRQVAAPREAQAMDPVSSVTRGADGLLYGTAARGGAYGTGSVYRVEADDGITVLHSFAADGSEGSNPFAGLLLAGDGWFYGGTSWGMDAHGTLFRISPAGEFEVLHVFSGSDHGPTYTLAQDAAGNLYGNVIDFAYDAVFKMTPDRQVTILHRFTGQADGGMPSGPLLLGADGTLYGTATLGPWSPCGEVFALAPDGEVRVLHSFMRPPAHDDGCDPAGALAVGRDRRLHGTTFGTVIGSEHPYGTAFSLSLQGEFALTHVFAGDDPLGSHPYGGLVANAQGQLFGTTLFGGAHGIGTVFSLSPTGVGRKTLHEFGHAGPADGAYPYVAPTVLPDGTLVGTTSEGGGPGAGTVYTLTPHD